MSEKVKILIASIEEKPWKDKIFYNCHTAMGVTYSTTDAKIKEYIGKEHEFDVNVVEKDGKTTRYINFQKEGGGGGRGKKDYTPKFADTLEGFKSSQHSYNLRYSVDLAIAYANLQIPKSFDGILDNVEAAYKRLLPILELDKLKEVVQSVPVQTQTPVVEYHLKPMLETTIKGKFKANNFSNRDIIDYCAALGIVMQNDPQSGDVFINKLSEADANLLINEMNKM